MAELSAAAASQAAASERDVLLATKLHVPLLRPDLVPRPRLAERLEQSLGRGLTLVCAPAGFGKTVLLADWVRARNHPVAWLSLDAGDNDPARFWRHLVAALDREHPGIAERAGSLLGPPAPASFEGLVTALVNELDAHPGDDEVLLVLDDYHLIDEGQPMAALLGRLIAAQRTGLAAARVPLDCLARLQRAIDAGPATPDHRPGTAAAVQGIVDPLTSRELEVLQMLAAGRPNQAIARELVVSLDTVKKHVSHILGKLGAASRTEAVARARQLALIP